MVKKALSLALLFVFFSFQNAFASFFIPISERDLYEEADETELSNFTIIGIKPYTYEKMLFLFGKENEEVNLWHKSFLAFLDFDSYFLTSKDAFSFVLDREGERLKEGLNGFLP